MDISKLIENKNAELKELHPYTLSLSKCISYMQEPFDAEGKSKSCSEKGFNDPNSKYYQMTPEDIVEKWTLNNEKAKEYGKKLDDYAEKILLKMDLDLWKLDNNFDYDERLQGLCKGFDQFLGIVASKTDYVFVARELPLYASGIGDEYINGRFDCLFYSPSQNRYMLIDWKTNEDFKTSNRFQKLKGPCFRMDDCHAITYSIQLGMYKKALCETYGITTPDRIETFICQFLGEPGGNGNNYILHKTFVDYDPKLLSQIIDFSYKKHDAIRKMKKEEDGQ